MRKLTKEFLLLDLKTTQERLIKRLIEFDRLNLTIAKLRNRITEIKQRIKEE